MGCHTHTSGDSFIGCQQLLDLFCLALSQALQGKWEIPYRRNSSRCLKVQICVEITGRKVAFGMREAMQACKQRPCTGFDIPEALMSCVVLGKQQDIGTQAQHTYSDQGDSNDTVCRRPPEADASSRYGSHGTAPVAPAFEWPEHSNWDVSSPLAPLSAKGEHPWNLLGEKGKLVHHKSIRSLCLLPAKLASREPCRAWAHCEQHKLDETSVQLASSVPTEIS